MKLLPIKREHIVNAGEYIDLEGIPDNNLWNNYWVLLPNGKEYPFKYLTTLAYQFTPGNSELWLDFKSTDGYRKYIEQDLKFPINYYKEGYSFITVDEIEHFEIISGKKYRKDNPKDQRVAQVLKPLVFKLNYWAKSSIIENFVARFDHHWQWSGTFKSYLWIRLYREGASQKIFFVLGTTSEGALNCKLDCLRSNYNQSGVLSSEVQHKFDIYLKEADYNHLIISKKSLTNLTWDELITETTRFIYKYSALYDELENLTNPALFNKVNVGKFILVEPPKTTKTYLDKKRTFEGKVIDWSQKQMTTKLLGDAGEKFVIEIEKHKLRNLGMHDKVDRVEKKQDGCGYDIRSFDEKGYEIHIEVKTTTGKKDVPFYFSINEKDYLEKYPENYFLYRLHEFKFNPESTKCFKLRGIELLNVAEFNGTNFEVSIIKNNE